MTGPCHHFRWATFLCGSVVLWGLMVRSRGATSGQPEFSSLPPAETRRVDFVRDIQPILADHCYSCHGPDKQKADLRWDSKESVFKGTEHGPVLLPGKSAESMVVQLVAGLKGGEAVMPKKGDRLT